MNSLRIAILVAGLPPDRVGGAELQAARAAEFLAGHHQVTVFTRTTRVPEELATAGRCRIVRRCGVNVRGLRFAADIAGTLRLIGGTRPAFDVILAYQTVIDGLIGVLARRLFGIPVLLSVRSESEYDFARSLQSRWLTPFVFRHADRLAVQSDSLARGMLRAFGNVKTPSADALRQKLCVVPNGLPATRETTPSTGDIVLFVGRLNGTKGMPFLIDAMRDCPDERLIVVGDGPDRAALERAARPLPNVTFTGMVSHAQVQEYFQQAKILVLPSLCEGQPNVVMEAMRHGVPVIGTRVGGIPDLIADGVTGTIVDPGDSGSIARQIRMLSSDPALRARLGAAAMREMDKYGIEAAFGCLEQELLSVVATRRAARAANAPA